MKAERFFMFASPACNHWAQREKLLRDNSGFCAFTVEYKSSYFKKIQFKTI